MFEIVILLGIIMLIGLALSMSGSENNHQEVYIVRTKPQTSGCGPISFFLLGVLVSLIVVLLFTTG